ncbi:MAG: hypothetical protein ABI700_11840 [Chloroflexota bacterium]
MSNQLQQNASPSLWDKLSLAQYVDMTLDLSPERCLDRLLRVDQPKREGSNSSRIVVTGWKTTADTYEVRIAVNYEPGKSYASVYFAGVILRTGEHGQTKIQGKFRLGTSNVISFAILLFFLAYFVAQGTNWFMVILAIVTFVGYAVLIRADYQRLRSLVYEALQPS